jgi:hypothetical protein
MTKRSREYFTTKRKQKIFNKIMCSGNTTITLYNSRKEMEAANPDCPTDYQCKHIEEIIEERKDNMYARNSPPLEIRFVNREN